MARDAGRGKVLQKKNTVILCGAGLVLLYLFSIVLGPLIAPRHAKMELSEHLMFQGVWNVAEGRKTNDRERIEKGYRLYEQAVLIDPSCLQALHNLGYMYLHQRRPEKAKNCFKEIVKRLPPHSPLIPVYRKFMDRIDL